MQKLLETLMYHIYLNDKTLRCPTLTATNTYNYYRRDHLGNNCAVWDATNDTTLQKTVYYASGLPMSVSSGQSTQPYKYNGKEFIEMHGYDTYDIAWRQYYPSIGRFQSIDPEIEDAYNESPYAMCDNNMVNRTDPDGRFWNYVVAGGIGAGLDYGFQVYDNYQSGSTGYDAWVGNVNFVSVGLSAVNPTGKFKLLTTVAIELVKAGTKNTTLNDGLQINTDIKDVVTTAAVNTVVDVGVGKLTDAGSTKSVQNANKELSTANKQLKTAESQSKRSPNSTKKAENVSAAKSNEQTARNKQVRTQMLNSTVGQAPNATQQAAKTTTDRIQKDEKK